MKATVFAAAAIVIAATGLPSTVAEAAQPRAVAERQADRSVTPLDSGWQFVFAGKDAGTARPDPTAAGWEPVSMPHTWNRVGVYESQVPAGTPASALEDKRMGVGWYRLAFDTPQARTAGERSWLEFDAVSRVAEVWLNGVYLGRHAGGFSRFRFDATSALVPVGRNELVVKVDNTVPTDGNATADALPLTGDFFVYGGIYRPVRLVRTAPVHFDLRDHGGPGVYAATTGLTGRNATVAVRARVANDSAAPRTVEVRLQLADARGRTAAAATVPLTLAAGQTAEVSRDLAVRQARLWQGTADPYLYTLTATVLENAEAADRIAQPFGIRTVRIDPDKGLFLNGKHLALRGVGLHQDTQGSGWAMRDDAVAETVATIRDMGANTIRLTHYQHGPAIHRLADRYGLILWDEIPLVTAWTLTEAQTETPPDLLANARQQLVELIRQNENHASTAVWGIANEIDFGPTRPDFLGRPPKTIPSPVALLENLQALAKETDPYRPTALATCCLGRVGEGIPDVGNITDTLGANRYFGWYYGKPEELGPHLDALHRTYPKQPLAVTEYGAGGALAIPTDDPLGGRIDMGGHDQPEAYQTWLHVKTWPVIRDRAYLWASWLWNAFDFSSTVRKEGDSVDINTKGLVSYDGGTRKDAFYFYRANWSAAPTVHVSGRRTADRAYAVTDVEVFSNAASTSLALNGRNLGAMRDCPDRRCVWKNVRLSPGTNRLVASGAFGGKRISDAIEWRLSPEQAAAFRIDSGALVAGTSPGSRYGSDAFFEGGEAATADKKPRGRPAVLAAIAGTDRRDLLATYRKGRFAYRVPLANGRYRVRLDFVEPDAAAGARAFDVVANGRTAIAGLDVAASAGGPLKALRRSFAVDVADGQLVLQFVPGKGDAIVSAIAIER